MFATAGATNFMVPSPPFAEFDAAGARARLESQWGKGGHGMS